MPGWINADAAPGVGDVVLDLHDPGALPRDSYREIYGCHVLEHCWPQDTPAILKRMHDALVPGGTLRLSVPDVRLVVQNCVDSHAYGGERSALSVLYGGEFSRETSDPDRHRQIFWRERLERLLKEAGFVNVRLWGRGQYPHIDALKDYATHPCDSNGRSLISLNMEADRAGELPPPAPATGVGTGAVVDVSVILGTVNRSELLRKCVEAIRISVDGLSYEIVVAYGDESDESLPWMKEQPDIVSVLGGMDGAIEAFNRAYRASKGKYICQLNDDVVVDGDAVARAVRHLENDSSSAGVAFQFDRGDGKGYRHERFAGALHPNQMVARRETCETVVELIGAFWGDSAHRTDATYGGDTAFGAVCAHLGLRLASVEGVTCRDLLCDDALRARNAERVSGQHGSRWRAMYGVYIETKAQSPSAFEWPNLYVPRTGMPARRSPVEAGRPLRLAHLSLRSEAQADVRRALARIGPTVEVPWMHSGMNATLAAVRAHAPDVVWAQIQSDRWTDDMTNALRAAAGPHCTLVLWTGDVRTSAYQPVERWLSRAAHLFDIVLASNTTYARKLKMEERATAACGYMLCASEPPDSGDDGGDRGAESGGAVFFGTNYRSLDGGARERLLTRVLQSEVCHLYVAGTGWANGPLKSVARPFIKKMDTRAIMRRAPVTIVTSLYNNLGRYTSDRLARAASSGAVMAVREFVDMRGLGLRPGENCLTWVNDEQLVSLLKEWTSPQRADDRRAIRRAAVALSRAQLTWDCAVEQLLAIVRDYRARRGLS